MSRKDPGLYDHPERVPSLCGSPTGHALFDTPLSWAIHADRGYVTLGDQHTHLASWDLQALLDAIGDLLAEPLGGPQEIPIRGKKGDRWGIVVKCDDQGRIYVTVDSVAYIVDQQAIEKLTRTRCPCCKRSIKRVRLMRIFETGQPDEGERWDGHGTELRDGHTSHLAQT